MVTHSDGQEGNTDRMSHSTPSKPGVSDNHVITVAAGYSVEQIRPFLASLQHFAPGISLHLIVDRLTPEYEKAVRGWFPQCTFHLLPASPLRDFGLKRKWARSILKRIVQWSGSREFAVRLLKVNILRYLVVCDLLNSWNLPNANILLTDSRDVVFQANPFSDEWPLLWTCKEDKRIDDCGFNSRAFKQAGGEAAF